MVLPQHSIRKKDLDGHHYFIIPAPCFIETLHNEGRSLRYIANYLGFIKTTIINELHRLNSKYQAELAQTDFE